MILKYTNNKDIVILGGLLYFFYISIIIAMIVAPWSLLVTIFLDGKLAIVPGIYHQYELKLILRVLLLYTPMIVILTYFSRKKKNRLLKMVLLVVNLFFIITFFNVFTTKSNLSFILQTYSFAEVKAFVLLLTVVLTILVLSLLLFICFILKSVLPSIHLTIKEVVFAVSTQKRTVFWSLLFVLFLFLVIYASIFDLYLILNS